ncbi:helix-turn-helix domain-containing protein [Verrucosispora sp. TAA-831]|uniref:helix-turn-helix domain-containing protein n=1 Tax=Verrucosispora sp. TAA-831 TaxID=3422227 RepID=UPI003D6EF66B
MLKQHREQAGMSIEGAAKAAGISGPHLSRIERARVGVRVPVVKLLLQTYRADAGTIEEMVEIAGIKGDRGWWHDFPSINRPYQTLIGFEAVASTIRNYEPFIVPGLLQTEEYTRALLQRGPARLSEETISERITVRTQRQTILDRDDPPVLSFVLDEAAIRRPVGGPDVMRQQLQHILDVATRPNVDVAVIPFAAGAHPGSLGSFVIHSFAPGERDAIYIEGMAGDLYPERRVEWYIDVFNRLQSIALSDVDSVHFIRKAIEEMKE